MAKKKEGSKEEGEKKTALVAIKERHHATKEGRRSRKGLWRKGESRVRSPSFLLLRTILLQLVRRASQALPDNRRKGKKRGLSLLYKKGGNFPRGGENNHTPFFSNHDFPNEVRSLLFPRMKYISREASLTPGEELRLLLSSLPIRITLVSVAFSVSV